MRGWSGVTCSSGLGSRLCFRFLSTVFLCITHLADSALLRSRWFRRNSESREIPLCGSAILRYLLGGSFMAQIPKACEGCGLCCCNDHDTKWIEVSAEDANRIPIEFLQRGDITPFAMKQTANGRCVCLDDLNRCSIYPLRPTICREVMPGDDLCVVSIKRSARE